MCRLGRGGLPKFVARESTKKGRLPDYSRITLLAFLPTHDEAASGAIATGYETKRGTHACREAEMVILDEMDRLYAEQADPKWVLHLLYIVARGLPVTTAAVAKMFGGDMRKINVSHVREHVPQMHREILFKVTKALHRECPALASGIDAINRMKSSRWRFKIIENDEGLQPAPPAAGGAQQQQAAALPKAKAKAKAGRPSEGKIEVRIPDLSTMWEWLKNNRIVVNAKHTRMCWRRDIPTAL